MHLTKKHFEASMVFTDDTIRRMFRTEFYSYELPWRLLWTGIGAGLILAALFTGLSTAVKAFFLLAGCLMLSMPDFLSRIQAEGVIMQRGGAVSKVAYEVTSSGISIEGGRQLPFKKVDRLVEDDQYYYIFQSRQNAVMLPKEGIRRGSSQELGAFISQMTGKSWKRSRSLWSLTLKDLICLADPKRRKTI